MALFPSVSCDLLLEKLHSLMEKNKNGHSTLSLLRSDSDLCCDDLTDGALNVYVAQIHERLVRGSVGDPSRDLLETLNRFQYVSPEFGKYVPEELLKRLALSPVLSISSFSPLILVTFCCL